MKQTRYVYILHGFGDITAYSRLKFAREAQEKYGAFCSIQKAPVETQIDYRSKGAKSYPPLRYKA